MPVLRGAGDGMTENTLDQLITAALRAQHEAREAQHPRDHSVFHDSSANSCLRKRVLIRSGAEVAAPQADDLRNFEFGHMIHGLIQRALLAIGAIPIVNGVALLERTLTDAETSGTFDCLVKLNGSGYTLMDIKTCSVFAFQHLKEEGAKPGHMQQVCRYWLKLKGLYPIHDVQIYYIEKDKGFTRDFVIPMTEGLIRETTADLTAEQEAWGALPTLPPRIAAGSPDAWQCHFCSVYEACGEREKISKFSPTFDRATMLAFKKGGAQ